MASDSSQTSDVSTSQQCSSSISLPNIHHFLSIKLSPSNYVVWRSQFLPLLRSSRLICLVDGSFPPPSKVLADKNVNPAYLTWYHQDQTLLSWILSSLTEDIHSQVVGLDSASAVWNFLETTYASHSQARVMQLRLSLHNIKKGSNSMETYLLRLKRISDALSLAGKPVSDEEMVLFTLGGLGSEFSSFVTSLTTRDTPVCIRDFHGLLLNEEIRSSSVLQELTNVMTNVGIQDSQSSGAKGTSISVVPPRPSVFRGTGSRGTGFRGGSRGYSQGPGPYRGYERSFGNVCQICGHGGHYAHICYQQLPPSSPMVPQAHLVQAPFSPPVTSWFPDTGATHHMTPNLGVLQGSTPYDGSSTVCIGNGTGSILGEYPSHWNR